MDSGGIINKLRKLNLSDRLRHSPTEKINVRILFIQLWKFKILDFLKSKERLLEKQHTLQCIYIDLSAIFTGDCICKRASDHTISYLSD